MHIGQRFEVLGDYAVRYWAQPARDGWLGFHQVTGPGADGRVRQTSARHDLLGMALDEAFRDGRALIRNFQGCELRQRRLATDPVFAW
jgi:hypothetical protein